MWQVGIVPIVAPKRVMLLDVLHVGLWKMPLCLLGWPSEDESVCQAPIWLASSGTTQHPQAQVLKQEVMV